MKFTVYGTSVCPYCTKAKNLLERKGYSYTYVDLKEDEGSYDYIVNGLGLTKVPQIFSEYGGEFIHVGGYEELSSYLP